MRNYWVIAGALAICCLVVACGAIFVLSGTPGPVIWLEVAKVLMSLIVAIIVTGLISSTLSRRAQQRTERIAKLRALSWALQDLKGAYEQMSVARTMLRANLSGRTFEEQLPAILSCRARLQRIERDRVIGDDDLTGERGPIAQMVTFTREVRNFYIANYAQIARSTLIDELHHARLRDDVDMVVEPTSAAKLDLTQLSETKFLEELIGTRCIWHQSTFRKGYNRAKETLEEQIVNIRSQVETITIP
jgi:hypothetical protein